MSELAETYDLMRKRSQDKRADNREKSASYLTSAGVHFTSHNNGAHLIVEGKDCYIDFWPGTGRWSTRDGKRSGFGVKELVKFIDAKPKVPEYSKDVLKELYEGERKTCNTIVNLLKSIRTSYSDDVDNCEELIIAIDNVERFAARKFVILENTD